MVLSHGFHCASVVSTSVLPYWDLCSHDGGGRTAGSSEKLVRWNMPQVEEPLKLVGYLLDSFTVQVPRSAGRVEHHTKTSDVQLQTVTHDVTGLFS